MTKTILITGATDGIGLAAAKLLASEGHHLILHGRNPKKLEEVKSRLSTLPNAGIIKAFVADFSNINEVDIFAKSVAECHDHLDVLINNAGVFRAGKAITVDGLDIRFAVNTIAPWQITQRLLPECRRTAAW